MFKYCENQKFRLPLTIFQFSFKLNFQQYYKFCLQTSRRKLIISSKYYDSWSWFSIFFFWISSMLLVSIVGTSRPISFLVILIVTLSVFFVYSFSNMVYWKAVAMWLLLMRIIVFFFFKNPPDISSRFSPSLSISSLFSALVPIHRSSH